MTLPHDPLGRTVRLLRSRTPPPERSGLRGDLLVAFTARRPRAGPRWVAVALAAAALMLAATALLLRGAPPARAPDPQVALLRAELESLHATLDRLALRAEARRPEAPPAAGAGAPAPGPVDRLIARATEDPALYRLAAARAFERIDPAAAALRYRQLLDLYDAGPAAAAARRRLAALAGR